METGNEIQVSPDLSQEVMEYKKASNHAMELVDDIVLKRYLSNISSLEADSFFDEFRRGEVLLYRINRVSYDKDEYATDKFESVIAAMTHIDCSVFLIIDGHKERKTDFYIGVHNSGKKVTANIAATLKNAFLGQFPGSDIGVHEDGEESYIAEDAQRDKILTQMLKGTCVSSCVGVPSYKNTTREHNNSNFIQGVEKFVNAMQGQTYTAIILASNITKGELNAVRNSYERIYSDLSSMATKQLGYSTNESLANAISRTKGYSDTHTVSTAETVSHGKTSTISTAETTGESDATTRGSSKENAAAKVGKALAITGAALAGVGITIVTGGAAAPAAAVIAAKIGLSATGAIGLGAGMSAAGKGASIIGGKTKNESKTTTKTRSTTKTISAGVTETTSTTTTISDAHTDSFSETDGETSTVGTSKNFTITVHDKHIEEILKRIDKQLERIELSEAMGMWMASTYIIGYDNHTAESGAAVFNALMSGEQSGVETSAVNTWREDSPSFESVLNSIACLRHPVFNYYYYNSFENGVDSISVTATSMINSKELSLLMGLPRKSVPGLPIVEHSSLAKEVVRFGHRSGEQFNLGYIFDQGRVVSNDVVSLDRKSLCQHTFVTGSTGSGKSNTVYYLLDQMKGKKNNTHFLIIEPAKGEYKNVFGNIAVYGTNPNVTDLLRINPFRFPHGVHVLEHIDRLIEIFGVCWPMYAAMPAVLKEAVLQSYAHAGWNLDTGENMYSMELFPCFADLEEELVNVINKSAYSEEVKSNYTGSLVTRVHSLANGLSKQIFTGSELGDETLFDNDAIVDLSRIGSQETKSLIMGILIMRLSEYRSVSDIEANSDLRHITVLEEAHNILRRCSPEQNPEGSNVAAKSVEMISNCIAEMRTYGEGFIIVDQSPGVVDMSAIRNTNTKIVMRLPEESDRKIAGKSAAMKDNQIDEIAKLPTGVAVVYQNDWEDPVLCKINEYTQTPIKYEPRRKEKRNGKNLKSDVLALLLSEMIADNPFDMNSLIATVRDYLPLSDFSTYDKIHIYRLMSSIEKSHKPTLWYKSEFSNLAALVARIVAKQEEVNHLANGVSDFNALDERIKELVEERVGALDERLYAATESCLMKTYSTSCDAASYIYNAWCNKKHRLL